MLLAYFVQQNSISLGHAMLSWTLIVLCYDIPLTGTLGGSGGQRCHGEV